jgi:hypothetical protein
LFDALDIRLPTPTSGKKSTGSKLAAILGKPGVFSVLSSFVFVVIPSTSLHPCLYFINGYPSTPETCV